MIIFIVYNDHIIILLEIFTGYKRAVLYIQVERKNISHVHLYISYIYISFIHLIYPNLYILIKLLLFH